MSAAAVWDEPMFASADSNAISCVHTVCMPCEPTVSAKMSPAYGGHGQGHGHGHYHINPSTASSDTKTTMIKKGMNVFWDQLPPSPYEMTTSLKSSRGSASPVCHSSALEACHSIHHVIQDIETLVSTSSTTIPSSVLSLALACYMRRVYSHLTIKLYIKPPIVGKNIPPGWLDSLVVATENTSDSWRIISGGNAFSSSASSPTPSRSSIVVDFTFRTKFCIARPTPHYETFVQNHVPIVFIGTYEALEQKIDHVMNELHTSLYESGLEVAPWRTPMHLKEMYSNCGLGPNLWHMPGEELINKLNEEVLYADGSGSVLPPIQTLSAMLNASSKLLLGHSANLSASAKVYGYSECNRSPSPSSSPPADGVAAASCGSGKGSGISNTSTSWKPHLNVVKVPRQASTSEQWIAGTPEYEHLHFDLAFKDFDSECGEELYPDSTPGRATTSSATTTSDPSRHITSSTSGGASNRRRSNPHHPANSLHPPSQPRAPSTSTSATSNASFWSWTSHLNTTLKRMLQH